MLTNRNVRARQTYTPTLPPAEDTALGQPTLKYWYWPVFVNTDGKSPTGTYVAFIEYVSYFISIDYCYMSPKTLAIYYICVLQYIWYD